MPLFPNTDQIPQHALDNRILGGDWRDPLKGSGTKPGVIEFVAIADESPKEMLSLSVTRVGRQMFTPAWRRTIRSRTETQTANPVQMYGAAREVYSGYPEIQNKSGLR